MEDLICTCGDSESQHIDGEAQCVVPECGCKEFELKGEFDKEDFSDSGSELNK